MKTSMAKYGIVSCVIILNLQAAENVWIPPCQVIVRTRRDTPDSINLVSPMPDNSNASYYKEATVVQHDLHPVNIPKSKILPDEYVGNVAFLLVPTGNHADPWSTYIIPPICFPSKISNENATSLSDLPETVTIKNDCNCSRVNNNKSADTAKLSKHPGTNIPSLPVENDISAKLYSDVMEVSDDDSNDHFMGSGMDKTCQLNEEKVNQHTPSTLHSSYPWTYPNPFLTYANALNEKRFNEQPKPVCQECNVKSTVTRVNNPNARSRISPENVLYKRPTSDQYYNKNRPFFFKTRQ